MTHETTSQTHSLDKDSAFATQSPDALKTILTQGVGTDNDYVERRLLTLESRDRARKRMAAYVASHLPEVVELAKTEAEAEMNGKSVDVELPERLPSPDEADILAMRELLDYKRNIQRVPAWRTEEESWRRLVNDNAIAINELNERIRKYSGVDMLGILGVEATQADGSTPMVNAYPEVGATGTYRTQQGNITGKVVAAQIGGPYVLKTPEGLIEVSNIYR